MRVKKTSKQMKVPAIVIAVACGTGAASAASLICSSLNGPFCNQISHAFAVPPAHASTNLDRPIEVHVPSHHDIEQRYLVFSRTSIIHLYDRKSKPKN